MVERVQLLESLGKLTMDAHDRRSKVFEVLEDPCAYLQGARRFIPLRKLRRLAERERSIRAPQTKPVGRRVANVA